MGSSRLPGKVLSSIAGKPALTRLANRLKRCQLLDDVILATTDKPEDDALKLWADTEGMKCYRGSENDVLLRVVEAHRQTNTEVIVEITADCILSDPDVIDLGITTFLQNDCDVVSNAVKVGYPMGICVQVFPFKLLEEVAERIEDPPVREHVSLYFYEHPELYRVIHMFPPRRWWHPEYRLCLDYPEDLVLHNAIYERLEPSHGEKFGTEEIVQLLNSEPGLSRLNAHCQEKAARP